MKEVLLSGGRKAKIRLAHVRLPELKSRDGDPRKGTVARLTIGRRTFKATALLHPGDNFCRQTGRKAVANQLLKRCRQEPWLATNLSQSDRRRLFLAICPEYATQKSLHGFFDPTRSVAAA